MKGYHRTVKGEGLFHAGSFLAQKIEYEDSSEALELFSTARLASLPGLTQHLYINAFILSLLCLEICPRTLTSTEN